MSPDTATVACPSCGGAVPQMDGPTHPYMESSPGCWHVFGEILEREYGNPAFAAQHRLTVDNFAVQHPGQPSSQSIQSVCLHLISLCLVLERGVAPAYATRVLSAAARDKQRFVWLTPPESLGVVTVADVRAVSSARDHTQRVRDWAESAWTAWSPHHETIRAWLPGEG